MASLQQKVAALRNFFGVPAEVPLLQAIEAMHAAMGSVPEVSQDDREVKKRHWLPCDEVETLRNATEQ